MDSTILTTLTASDLEAMIIRSLNAALKLNNMLADTAKLEHLSKTPLPIERACEITGLAKSTIYYLAPKGLIPCQKKGKRLYFFEDELVAWIKAGRRSATQQVNPKEATHG